MSPVSKPLLHGLLILIIYRNQSPLVVAVPVDHVLASQNEESTTYRVHGISINNINNMLVGTVAGGLYW